ncbi:MAG: hypothetical protein DMF66_17610 [Acidobacteria bacterium]|nr:MAG: hypothetical protein DMF66_17610 [Acidobacteriota bacterium]
MVEPVIRPFVELVKQVELKAPKVPYVSNLTGAWIKVSQAIDPNYWGDHLRRAVRFSDGLRELLADPRAAVLEVGPGMGLSGLVKKHPARAEGQDVFASMRHPKDRQTDQEFLLRSLGALWLSGVRIDWPGLHAGARQRKVRLPTYPFERRRYWVDPPRARAGEMRPVAEASSNGHAPPPEALADGQAAAARAPERPTEALVRVEQPPVASRRQPHAAAGVSQARAPESPAAPPADGHRAAPTPTQQIIAQQLKISSEQLRLMTLQLELLRHGRPEG